MKRSSPPPAAFCLPSRASGFTLIEMAITVLVVAILAAVAFPSFMDSVRKGRRSEAYAALSAMQQAEERWRSNNPNYTTTLPELGLQSDITSAGRYKVRADAPDGVAALLATGYVVTAVGEPGTSQADDAQCRKMSVKVIEGGILYAGCGSCAAFVYAGSNPCWNR